MIFSCLQRLLVLPDGMFAAADGNFGGFVKGRSNIYCARLNQETLQGKVTSKNTESDLLKQVSIGGARIRCACLDFRLR